MQESKNLLIFLVNCRFYTTNHTTFLFFTILILHNNKIFQNIEIVLVFLVLLSKNIFLQFFTMNLIFSTTTFFIHLLFPCCSQKLLFWQEESTFSLFQPSNNNNNPFSISFISCTHISKPSEKHSFWHICQQISHFLSLLHLSKNSSTKPPITLFLYTNLTKQHIFTRKHTLYNTNKSTLKILYFDLIIYIFCTFLLPFHYMQWISLKTINNHTFMYANQNHFRFLVHNQKYPQNR